MGNFIVYPSGDVYPDEPFAVPFHMPCYQLFAQMVAYYTTGKISWSSLGVQGVEREVLWQVMRGLMEDYAQALTLDYGELLEMSMEQYWWCQPGFEASFLPCPT
jgi:hypothetical protein